jgi:hypothetical protein
MNILYFPELTGEVLSEADIAAVEGGEIVDATTAASGDTTAAAGDTTTAAGATDVTDA